MIYGIKASPLAVFWCLVQSSLQENGGNTKNTDSAEKTQSSQPWHSYWNPEPCPAIHHVHIHHLWLSCQGVFDTPQVSPCCRTGQHVFLARARDGPACSLALIAFEKVTTFGFLPQWDWMQRLPGTERLPHNDPPSWMALIKQPHFPLDPSHLEPAQEGCHSQSFSNVERVEHAWPVAISACDFGLPILCQDWVNSETTPELWS